MINYIEKLLTDLGYIKNEYNFFYREGDDFFRVDNYPEKELLDYFKSDVTTKVVDDYEKLIKSDDAAKINSTQIILVETTDLQNFFNNYKNQLMKIEEDPYYFRKYVIVYTDDAMTSIKGYTLSELENFVLKDENYEEFEKNMFSVPEYFLGMECYIKLPFLTLPIRDEKYSSLKHLLEDEIEKKEQKIAETKVIKLADLMSSTRGSDMISIENLINFESETEIIKLLKEMY